MVQAILEQLHRLIGLFLRAPATATAARIERVRELNSFLEHLAIAGFVLVAILGVVGARGHG